MTEMSEADRRLAQELLAAWDGSSAHRPAIEQAVNSMSEDAVSMAQTARRLVTAELVVRAVPDEDALVKAMFAAVYAHQAKHRLWKMDDCMRAALDAIRPHIAALQARAEAAEAKTAKLREALANPPRHVFWGAGEPDCPREIKACNGELHTLRCKICGVDNPRDDICRAALGDKS